MLRLGYRRVNEGQKEESDPQIAPRLLKSERVSGTQVLRVSNTSDARIWRVYRLVPVFDDSLSPSIVVKVF